MAQPFYGEGDFKVIKTFNGSNKKFKASDLAFIALFTAVIAICSWISVPTAVPFTMQIFGVFTAVGVLGGRRGTLAVLSYLLLGAVGVPVFAGFSGGIGHLMGVSGGYVIGFLFSAIAMWITERLLGRGLKAMAAAMVVGLFVCYAFGTVWFTVAYASDFGEAGVWTALVWCVFPYLIPDAVKIALALYACKKLSRLRNFDREF